MKLALKVNKDKPNKGLNGDKNQQSRKKKSPLKQLHPTLQTSLAKNILKKVSEEVLKS